MTERAKPADATACLAVAVLLAAGFACPTQAPVGAQSTYDRGAFGRAYRSHERAVFARDTVPDGDAYRTPYTCTLVSSRADTDIDHVVPLRWAWGRGLHPEQYRAFASDPLNLAPATVRENRQVKGAKGPAGYMPPRNAGWYAYRWLYLASRYHLRLSEADRAALVAAVSGTPDAPSCA